MVIETDGLMERLLEKFGLYVGHLKDSKSSAKNAARATLQGKLKKLVDAKGNIFGKDANVNINSDEGDRVLFDVASLLNCNVSQNSGETEEESCDRQLRSV